MKVRALTAALAATALAAVGCSAAKDASATDRTLTIVTYDAYALPKEAAAAFTKRTGWKVKVRTTGDAGTALGRAILTSGQPEGDVFFGVDNTFLSRAQKSNAFVNTRVDALSEVPDEFQLDSSGRFIPVDESSVCVNADQSWFDQHDVPVPTSMDDLIDPTYRGLLVVEDPAASSPGLAFLAATVASQGSGAKDYWEQLNDNDVAIAGSWDDAWGTRYTTNGGDRPLVVSYESSPPAEVIYSDGALTEPASVVVGGTCFRQVEFAAVLRGTTHRAAAQELVAEMLSEQWQASLPLSNFVYPVRAGVELPEEFTKWAPRVSNPLTLSASAIGSGRDTWLETWRDVMG